MLCGIRGRDPLKKHPPIHTHTHTHPKITGVAELGKEKPNFPWFSKTMEGFRPLEGTARSPVASQNHSTRRGCCSRSKVTLMSEVCTTNASTREEIKYMLQPELKRDMHYQWEPRREWLVSPNWAKKGHKFSSPEFSCSCQKDIKRLRHKGHQKLEKLEHSMIFPPSSHTIQR